MERTKRKIAAGRKCSQGSEQKIKKVDDDSFSVTPHGLKESLKAPLLKYGFRLRVVLGKCKRSISPSDKTIALGLANALANLLSYIPYPLVYGAVIDGSCLVWESACGTSGNCWLYDLAQLRHSYLGTSAGLLFVSGLFSVAVAAVVGDIRDFYGDAYLQVSSLSAVDFEPPKNGFTKHKKADVKQAQKGPIRN